MFWQISGNAQISHIGDVKTAKILFKFLIDQKKTTEQFLTINRYFSQP